MGKPQRLLISFLNLTYQYISKPILFLIDSESIHEAMTSLGEIFGKSLLAKKIIAKLLQFTDPRLKQNLAGIAFNNPVGLSAGFDYEAKLTQLLPCLDFGFATVGTITHLPYEGNPKPRLGRLPKSHSIMVNKGFKNLGAKKIITKLKDLNFNFPLGVSIGRTNSPQLQTPKQGIKDIISAFILFEKAKVKNSYYELNISCPNLLGKEINFYSPADLTALLTAIDQLNIRKPIFIKMPIVKTNSEILEMLEIITKFNITGLIFGNLQTNRKDPAFDPDEVAKFKVGNFSGKSTEKRSNELIKLTYQKYKKRFVIIGCGGIFSAEDAYKKIKLGASLVQLITGMIFKGPQLISQINLDLADLLERDNFTNIAEAVGVESLEK